MSSVKFWTASGIVIPAKAGIHFDLAPEDNVQVNMDPSLRWNDGDSRR